jgi:hypothetical protein
MIFVECLCRRKKHLPIHAPRLRKEKTISEHIKDVIEGAPAQQPFIVQ